MTAAASWLFAKSAGGRWLIRIEDLDRQRSLPGCADEQLRLLASCGLSPDGEVVFQSARTGYYDSLFETLRKNDLVYPCRCSRREIALAAVAPHDDEEPVYPGTCGGTSIPREEIRAWRFLVPDGKIVVTDEIFGEIRQDVARTVGDFIVRREQPVTYSYQFAVVADDAAQEVTQVVRGADLLGSTPRQVALQEAFGFRRPRYAHVPTLVSSIGVKLSKRAGSQQLASAVARGMGAEILGALLATLGQAPTLTEALAAFDPRKIPRQRQIPLVPWLGTPDQNS